MKLYNIKYTILAVAVAAMAVSCNDDDDVTTPAVASTDFTGTFVQQDQMGRPGINTVFVPTGMEDAFNVTIPANGISQWRPTFQATVEGLHSAYGTTYENNVLGLDLPTLTTALALDVLQVAPEGTTSYFDLATGLPLTGRALEDDVIDISLILLFGGANGDRFDGDDGLPELVTDNVGLEPGVTQASFPYLVPARF